MSEIDSSSRFAESTLVGQLDTRPSPETLDLLADRLEIGVGRAYDTIFAPLSPGEQPPDIEDLKGEDNGLYEHLTRVAEEMGYRVEDNDEVTKDILRDGRKGLRKEFAMGWVTMVKQGSPLQMTATLAHEIAHEFAPDINDESSLVTAETIAEGAAHVVCDYFGLDISAQSLRYIAGYNAAVFTSDMREGIIEASSKIIESVQRVAG